MLRAVDFVDQAPTTLRYDGSEEKYMKLHGRLEPLVHLVLVHAVHLPSSIHDARDAFALLLSAFDNAHVWPWSRELTID